MRNHDLEGSAGLCLVVAAKPHRAEAELVHHTITALSTESVVKVDWMVSSCLLLLKRLETLVDEVFEVRAVGIWRRMVVCKNESKGRRLQGYSDGLPMYNGSEGRCWQGG